MDTTVLTSFPFGRIIVSSVCAIFLLALMLLSYRGRTQAVIGVGRAVLITGCDSGFGHHLARRLDAQGFVVFAGCLFPNGDGAQTLHRESSSNMNILKLDVTKDEDVTQARTVVQSNLPEKGLWAVVNNAGISDWSETEWNSIDDYRNIAEVNLFGSIRTSLAFLPLVRTSKGRMVYVSSIFAFFNCLTMGAYSMSKRGLEAFADCLRVEMAGFGVKVSIIQPGNFGPATSILKRRTGTEIWEKLDEERQQMFNRQYVDLANNYHMSTCMTGNQDSSLVIDAMVDALTAYRPKRRYLLVSKLDMLFFYAFPYLPTRVTDAVFYLSPMYNKRKAMLYSK
ncbi:D-beta-hydroxybutyrate dehydrogenase, mitochondrial [Salvelinus sp. IW2-2015]|uniref:D-beta-hydroxybutyrate dehydrogenase, mitochondrial n=1 Tax=Salvelinus sp. IW2-2015 TaxID=2691554 RepID=UPI000CDF907B|nr:D-beta-hydroxybutyrate dehydrogenase, mitochondrial [Salvelinus alpinus]